MCVLVPSLLVYASENSNSGDTRILGRMCLGKLEAGLYGEVDGLIANHKVPALEEGRNHTAVHIISKPICLPVTSSKTYNEQLNARCQKLPKVAHLPRLNKSGE